MVQAHTHKLKVTLQIWIFLDFLDLKNWISIYGFMVMVQFFKNQFKNQFIHETILDTLVD